MKWNRSRFFQLNEIWGGLAAMLVALPQSIAFGILVFTGLGGGFVSEGAVAGAVGAAIIGVMAPLFGGTPRLISSPCAPAAAFLAGLLGEEWLKNYMGGDPALAIPIIGLVGLSAGVSQILFSFLGGGKVIKYIPYPVVSGYMSAVGIIIIIGQLPKLIGVVGSHSLLDSIITPDLWNGQAIAIGAVTIATMYLSPRITKKIPAPILGLTGGLAAFALLSVANPENFTLPGNPLVIGTLHGKLSADYFVQRFSSIRDLNAEAIKGSIVAGATLAVVLSIDTLKTGVIVDTLSRNRSNSSRELIGQGIANISSAMTGGIAGAGTLGATLVNFSSGGTSRISGIYSGLFALFAFLALTPFLAWLPVASLAGILIFVALRTIDWKTLSLSLYRSMMFDFIIILAVIVIAVMNSLTAAAGAGFILSALFFLRDQIRGSVIHRKSYGGEMFSRKNRLPEEIEILQKENRRTVIYELQGNLFFGNTDQILSAVYEEPPTIQFVIIGLRRVHTFDSTAVHLFEQIESLVADRKGRLILSHLPETLPGGEKAELFLKEFALVRTRSQFFTLKDMHDAIEWTEEYILDETLKQNERTAPPLELNEIEIFSELNETQIRKLKSLTEERHYEEGENIFSSGQFGDEIFFIRKGVVKIMLKMEDDRLRHLASFGRGDFFGDMSFVDRERRSADAIAGTETFIYTLSRSRFDKAVTDDPSLGNDFYFHLSRVLSFRFRTIHKELRSLE